MRQAAGTLADGDLIAVGRALAGFHGAAKPSGGEQRLTGIVEETLAALEVAGVPMIRLEGSRASRTPRSSGSGLSWHAAGSPDWPATATATCAPSTC